MFLLLLNYAKVDNIGRKTIRLQENAGTMFNCNRTTVGYLKCKS